MSAHPTVQLHHRRRASALIGALAATIAIIPAAHAQSPSAGPADAPASSAPSPAPYPATVAAPGAEQAARATAWWQWLLSFPVDQDASTATTCLPSPKGGPVMLPQTYFGTIQQLTCSIDAGGSVLVSAGGTICTADPGDTPESTAACVADNDATIHTMSIAVDGRMLPDIGSFHALTGPFDLVLGKDNAFGVEPGSLPAQASATVALLSGLAPGTHTIVARDETEDPVLGTLVAESITTLEVK
jgi:hypothetical protein